MNTQSTPSQGWVPPIPADAAIAGDTSHPVAVVASAVKEVRTATATRSGASPRAPRLRPGISSPASRPGVVCTAFQAWWEAHLGGRVRDLLAQLVSIPAGASGRDDAPDDDETAPEPNPDL